MIVCAEIGLSHEGSLGMAMAMVDACAGAGVDCVKAQNHAGDACNAFRENTFFPQDETRAEYWARTAFTRDHWRKLADHCHAKGLQFSCSVFSLAGLEFTSTIVDILKIPSSKTNDHELLRAAAATGKPLVLSTGMSDRDEIVEAENILFKLGCHATVLQCTSEYPTPPEHIGLNEVPWPMPWGLSDHSGKIWPGIVAAWLGADMLECHVCWSRQQWGPDVSSSLTIDELRQLVEAVKFVERMRASTVTKDDLAKSLEPVRRVFRGN